MSGKAYSIREMKTIVDYLIEHKAYGETKGRKMWVDFANSQLTNRTWQSLKETFLKRIMPDIHNPYYKLTIEQINSFRQGYDIAERNKNKLDIQTVSGDSTDSADNQKKTDTGNAREEKPAGEDIKCSKISLQVRSSAETVILDNCYETTEEIQRDLESPVEDMKKEQIGIAAKSLRDCITYSEPLTPMIQEVLDDFASDPEDEPPMVIVESSVPDTDSSDKPNLESKSPSETNISEDKGATDVAQNAKGPSKDVVEELLLSEIKEFANDISKNQEMKNNETLVTEHLQTENTDDNTKAESSDVTAIPPVDEVLNLETDLSTKDDISPIDKTKSTPEKGTQNCSNSTTDTLLPNNPECLGKIISNEAETQNKDDGSVIELSDDIPHTSATRKRTASQDKDKEIQNKKMKLIDENKTTENEKVKAKESVSGAKIDKDNANKNEKSPEKPQVKNTFNIIETPSTSKEVKSILVASVNKTTEIENPCLKNVSLFDEQFNNINYDTSETSEVEQLTPNHLPTIDKQTGNDKEHNDVVILKSHSDTDTNEKNNEKKSSKESKLQGVVKKQREKALANVFGFSSGPGTSRKRRLSRHKKNTSHNSAHCHNESVSSEWMSETDSDLYVSPPRARKYRPSKKYLKPQSLRILSLEEEGGMFVTDGKKIYPLVKDGKTVKNFLTYLPSESEEEDESYWKLKYVEEKKKSNELKKLLDQAKESRQRDSKSPILLPKSPRNSRSSLFPNQQNANNSGKELCIPDQAAFNANTSQEKIKIRFTKKDEEVHLEGQWRTIHPALVQVVQLFHLQSEPTVQEKKIDRMIVEPGESKTNSRCSTPAIITAIDPEVHERVNEIEKEIFKEIEERHKEEQSTQNKVESNITKRKPGRPRKSSSSSQTTLRVTDEPPKLAAETENKAASVETATRVSTRRSKNLTPGKMLNGSAGTNETKTLQTRGSKSKLNDDDEVRYMFPPNTKRQARSVSNTRTKNQKPPKRIKKAGRIFSSLSNLWANSLDSTQGYQDSDISPARSEIRKKKFVNRNTRALSNVRRRSHPYLYCEDSNDSSNSSSCVPLKTIAQDSSLNPEAYKSDSYQLLMPQPRRSFVSLERIDEVDPIETSKNQLSTGHTNSDIASSSSMSLPLSPELSIVEILSISKEMINHSQTRPTINETQCNEINDVQICNKNKYIISGVDVTMPLMQQNCGIETCSAATLEDSLTDPVTVVTESLLNKISTCNLRDQTPMTETLNEKLQNLLLESAKKVCGENIQSKENLMEVDDTTDIRTKVGNKKRCSTPRKRKQPKKSAAPKIASLVEEHVESCLFGGRKSCPPFIQDYHTQENVVYEEIANSIVTGDADGKRKGRLKKDVIKVKILKPKIKTAKENTTSNNASKTSVYTDSGINDSAAGVFIPIDDSIDLIHNHSETCILAQECCGDSVEFIGNAKSILSINSNSVQSNEMQLSMEYTDGQNNIPECFCSNAQDMKSFYIEANKSNIEDVGDTVYYSPVGTQLSHNSLITEDLSDDTQPSERPSKWYLLSEEETNSNVTNKSTMNTSNFGANLNQIFPITYAVPDLSTISETSKDIDSRKPTLESNADTMTMW